MQNSHTSVTGTATDIVIKPVILIIVREGNILKVYFSFLDTYSRIFIISIFENVLYIQMYCNMSLSVT